MKYIILLLCTFAILSGSANSTIKDDKLQNIVDTEYSNTLIDNLDRTFNSAPDPNNIQKNDATSLFIDAKRNWNKLSKSAKDYVEKLQSGTGHLEYSLVSPNGYFRYWFTFSGVDAIEEIDLNSNEIPDKIDFYDSCFTLVKNNYKNAGFSMPSGLYYDIYLSSSACGSSVYGYTAPNSIIGNNPNSTEKESNSCNSYIVIRTDYSNFYCENDYGFKVTSAHEFFHSVQMAIDVYAMNLFVMEGCAVWAEQWNHKDLYDGFQYLTNYFNLCDLQLNYKPANSGDNYSIRPYGTWIFYRYLTDMFGDGIIKKLYYNHIGTNENSAFEKTLKSYETNYQTVLKNFFLTQFIMSGVEEKKPIYYTIADTLSKNFNIRLEKTFLLNNEEINYNSKTTGNKRLQMLSSDYFRVNNFKGAEFTINTQDAKDTMVMVIIRSTSEKSSTNFDYQEVRLNGLTSATINLEYNPDLPIVSIAIMNLKLTGTAGASSYYILNITPYVVPVQSVDEISSSFELNGIYPIPASSGSVININTNQAGIYSYQIFNIEGKSIETGTFNLNSNSNAIPLNLTNYNSGIYLINVSDGKESRTANFIVQ